VKNSIHSSVRARHLGSRKRDESFRSDDGAKRETEITMLPSFACSSVSLLTVIQDSWYCLLRFICPSDKGRYCCRCSKASAVEEVSDNELDE